MFSRSEREARADAACFSLATSCLAHKRRKCQDRLNERKNIHVHVYLNIVEIRGPEDHERRKSQMAIAIELEFFK